jgi:hypothetical protein
MDSDLVPPKKAASPADLEKVAELVSESAVKKGGRGIAEADGERPRLVGPVPGESRKGS